MHCFLEYIYSLYTIKIIKTLAMTKVTIELSVVFKQLMTFFVQLFKWVCLLKVTQSLIITYYHECIFALHKFYATNEWNLYSM